MNQDRNTTRRGFMRVAGLAGAGWLLAAVDGPGQTGKQAASPGEGDKEEEVSPGEDLMREHGVLKRILLVYRDYIHRIDERQELPPDPLRKSARIIRSFVEDYHEKLEENHLFPRFKKANRLVDLVEVLQTQHSAGRRVTDHVLRLATPQALKETGDTQQLKTYLMQFVRMYEPHEAREDTVLFPALREIVPHNEYDALGEEFEEQEHELFGADGFGKIVAEVESIEKSLGLYELSQFTPTV